MDLLYEPLVKSSKASIPLEFYSFLDSCQKRDINRPAHTIYNEDNWCSKAMNIVHCIHHDMWPNSANTFITRHNPTNWSSNSKLENIQNQGCDVVPV